MRLEASQQLRLAQQMKLSPRMIQAMEILQLPIMALQERIEQELQSNPVLEQREPGGDDETSQVEQDQPTDRGEQDMVVNDDNDHREDFERLAEFTEEYGSEFATGDAPLRPRPTPAGERDRKLDAMANAPAPSQSLGDYLLEQWVFVEAIESIIDAGKEIIAFIDDDGYLRMTLEQVSQSAEPPVDIALLTEAIKLVQTLEPVGIGARDLRECLLLQLTVEASAGVDVSLETNLVANFLHDIEMNHLPRIAQKTGKSIQQIKDAIENISHLNPRPGLLIGERNSPVIRPDVMIDVNDNGDLLIWMPDGNAPQLYVSRTYQQLVRDRQTDKQTKQFIRRNLRNAQWLISAIEQRRETVRRVTGERPKSDVENVGE